MGMSASQARLLSLQARQSNLEYQGQQINQERSILSQQCTALYNSLLAMTVPTPPSTQDFTIVKYTGTNDAAKYTFDASSVKPGKNGKYTVTLGTIDYGANLTKNPGYVTTESGAEEVRGRIVQADDFGTMGTTTYEHVGYKESTTPPTNEAAYMKSVPGSNFNVGENVYMYQDGEFIQVKMTEEMKSGNVYTISHDGQFNPEVDKAMGEEITTAVEGKFEAKTIYKEALKDFYIADIESNTVKPADPEKDFIKVPGTNPQEYKLKDDINYLYKDGSNGFKGSIATTAKNNTLIAGKTAYTLKEALEGSIIDEALYKGYLDAIENAQIKDKDGFCDENDFFIYEDDAGNIHFALISDVNDNTGAAVTYDFNPTAEYTKNKEVDNVELEFDPASGRIKALTIPTAFDADGEPTTFTTIDLQAETVTDELAYKDAYAQYEYEQYLYDKKQQEINAKTEVIQQQDRNLELKLQRLDNERTQIKTEIEAVEKVINDNIESSYKTFSG